tara:strand:- start:82 stop:642 length:561 start_codon:yes stop_codon:yes gene_type:complete
MSRLTSLSTPATRIGDPWADTGANYLWELYNLGDIIPAFSGMNIIKDGFAKLVRSGDKDGVQSRIIETLKELEDSLGIERGQLEGELIACTFGTYDETLSSEQYFHKSNRDFRLAGLFRDLKVTPKPAGGHSEFFNMETRTAKAKFANAQRQSCKAIGLETVNWKRENGIYGCPFPEDNKKERGYA